MKIMKNLVKGARLLLFCMAIFFNSESILLSRLCLGQTINYATTFEELNNAITNAQDDDIIYVSKNITVPSSFSNSASSTAYMVAKKRITIEGLGADVTIKREGGKSILECNGSGAVVSLRNLTFDGGAIWTSDVVSNTSNSGVSGRSVIDVAAGATLNLESGTIIQNGFTTDSCATNTTDAGSAAYGGGIRVDWKLPGGGTINVKAGSIIRSCKARKDGTGDGYGGGIGAYNNAKLNLYGGIIEKCFAPKGGGIGCTYRSGTSSTTAAVIKIYGGTLQNNAALNGGALCCEGKTAHYINGGTIINNQASEKGGAIALIEADTLYLAAKGSSLVIENNSVSSSDAPVDQFGYEGIYIDPRSTANTLIENKTVAFDTNGGNTFPDLTVEKGHSLGEAFPGDPIKLGYIFSGWFTDNGTFRNQFTNTTIVTEDTTVYAKWDIAPVQIISPVPNAVLDPGSLTASGTGVPGYTVKITEGSKTLATTKVNSDGYWPVLLSNLPGGTHTVSVIQSDPYGNSFPAVTLSFKILKIPTLDLFDIILTEDLTYNGAIKQFRVTLKPNVTGVGTFTVKYFRVNPDGAETELDGPPTDVGRYRAKLYIEKSSDYIDAVLRIVYFPKS